MSSIIDALKKSDSNRPNENRSNVDQIQFGSEPPRQSRRGFWLLVMLLLLIAFGVFAWQKGWHHNVIGQYHAWFGDTEETNPTAEQNAPQTPPVVEPKPQTNKLTPPKPEEIKAKSTAKSTEQPTVVPAAEPTVAQNTEKPNNDSSHEEQIKPITKNTRPAENKQTDTLTVIDKPTKADDRKILEPTLKQDYLLVHQIDFEIRKNIPPIKLTVHIYDPEPENRMILLNGAKYSVGDVIEEVITVEDIVKEGVVLSFQDNKFLIPK